jgi:segregation and condensation protein A
VTSEEPFDLGAPPITPPASATDAAAPLVVDLEGYEGPLDVLLALARNQKVDLTHISILDLAEQYLTFISEARRLRLEIAADYLVMAAWLAYLKSRLLLPEPEDEDELSGPEMAARLTFQLQRLEAMREAAARLMARDRVGRDVFARGMPEGIRVIRSSDYECSLFELLNAYAEQRDRTPGEPLRLPLGRLYTVDEAAGRLQRMLGHMPNWERLEGFLPPEFRHGPEYRSAMAATLSASLEMAREGSLDLRQGQMFGPIYVKPIERNDDSDGDGGAEGGNDHD